MEIYAVVFAVIGSFTLGLFAGFANSKEVEK